MNNKKGQFIIDSSEAPKWILYPLLILICLLLLVVIIVMVLFIISWSKGDTQFIPFSIFGFHGTPIIMSSFHSSSIVDTSNSSECLLNGIKISCNKISLSAWGNITQ